MSNSFWRHFPWLSAFWTGFILLVSMVPGKSIPSPQLWGVDKWAHFAVYAILVGVIYYDFAIRQYREKNDRFMIIGALLFALTLGILMELTQGYLLVDRYFDLMDILANIIGSLFALLPIFVFRKIAK